MSKPGDYDAHPRGAFVARLGRVHDRVLDALARVSAGSPADRALAEVFRGARDLGSKERSHVGDVVYGVLRHRSRIDDLLERASRQERRKLALVEPPILDRLRVLAYLASEGASLSDLEALDRYGVKRLPGVMSRIVQGRLPPAKHLPLDALAVELSLPRWILVRLVDAFGLGRAEAIARPLLSRAPVTLRVSRSRANRDELVSRARDELGVGAEPTRCSPDGVVLHHKVDLFTWSAHRDGLAEVQDEGSQLVALALGVEDATAVLDACAGAGGKTLAMADLMPQDAKLTAVDPEAKKLRALEKRMKRAGGRPVVRVQSDLQELPADLAGAFDRVLVDAPCTGTGTFRRHPDLKWRLEDSDLSRHVARQKHLVTAAVDALAPGGRLAYATCSVLREENEDVVRHALEHDSRLEPLALSVTWGEALAGRLLATHEARIGPGPGEHDPDGFYVALMRRKA